MSAINREAAINALKEYFSDEFTRETEYGAYWHHQHVIDVIERMPSAEPEKEKAKRVLWTGWKERTMSNMVKPTGGCIKCAKSERVRTAYFCGKKRLTDKQLYNDKGYCSEFVPRAERRTDD